MSELKRWHQHFLRIMPMMLYIFNSEYEQQMRMVRREDDLPSLALNWYRNRWKTRWLSMGTEHIKTPLSHRCFNATCGAELNASHSNTFSLSSFPQFPFPPSFVSSKIMHSYCSRICLWLFEFSIMSRWWQCFNWLWPAPATELLKAL